ncbi:ATP-binding protein [Halogeometricum luteum]|uniref:AAA family ATPase n=1 Tax=Halogeometricum luteum TaxID=2950537 RepID=A0ABU2G813_9EURY|nr:AAA family ATPase [Halogeometricum sp. S3BR5-2]MDS0296952.1 AAA family ATPase [Halogeometricum sp. S3BR5-2]
MSILETAISVIVFLGLFASVEYVTYRVMECKHEKRGIYRLFFMLGWTTLALLHMWVVAPLLNLPPTVVVGLGLGILAIHIGGDLRIPILKTVGVIGLYPFALVYQFFVILLLVAEGITFVATLITISQLNFLSGIGPSDPQIQAALGLGIAASLIAILYYDPQGENGYYYATGRHLPSPSIDSEGIKEMVQENQHRTNRSSGQGVDTSTSKIETPDGHHPGTSRAPAMTPGDQEFEYNWTRSDISFDDVAGYYDVKERLAEEVLQPVQAAARGDDRYDRFGIEPSRGILFYGPPGTGKTLFARALAGELNISFLELGPADVTSKWINEGPQRIRQLFEEAEAVGPCVIFLDEAEHLFGGRDVGAGGAHAEDRKITSELLVHLTAEDRTAIVVGATNRPEDIDPAILRPGRLATHVEIGLPGEESRHAIFQSKLRGVPHDLTGAQLAQLASHTAGLSGADIEELVTDAKRRAALRDAQTVSVEDFPTPEELDTMTKDTHPESTADVDLSDIDGSASENAFDDDSTVGFQ